MTHLMNEEGCLRNLNIKTQTTKPLSELDEAMVVSQWKGKSFLPAKKGNPIKCHKCGGVGHFRVDCPTQDSDAIFIANAAEEEEEAVFTTVDEEDLSDGFW